MCSPFQVVFNNQNLRACCLMGMALGLRLVFPVALVADTVIISVTAPPALSTLIDSDSILSTSWSQSTSYTDVTISALVDSAIVGQTPTADAYLTTSIGPGTTSADEIARGQFTVPLDLPVCSPSNSCGAMVALFSDLSLGPGSYFLTLAPDARSNGIVGWFPAIDPTVVAAAGVAQGPCVLASTEALYPPASAFGPALGFCGSNDVMNFSVTEIAATPVPEPVAARLIGFGALFLLFSRGIVYYAGARHREPF